MTAPTYDFIMFPVPASHYAAVCALLGGTSTAAIATSTASKAREEAPTVGADAVATEATKPTAADQGTTSVGDIDAAGWPWDEAMHASTKTKTKEGLWRMKVGVSRPDPKPGFPKGDAAIGTASGQAEAGSAGGSASSQNAATEEDEFAAFTAADGGTTVSTRKFTDADLGALCNQAAQKLGDPAPVKNIITEFVEEGAVSHSRNVPDQHRAAFVEKIEKAAGIKFAG